MKHAILSAMLLCTSVPALAQHENHDHSTPMPTKQSDGKPMDHAAMDPENMDHAAMGHMDGHGVDHAGHEMSGNAISGDDSRHGADHAAMDHSTMDHSTMDHASMDHSGHAMPPANSILQRPVDARALMRPDNAADAIWGGTQMAASRRQIYAEHGGGIVSRFSIDRLETRIGDGAESYVWDAEFRIGGDMDGVVLSSEGSGLFDDGIEHAEVQAVWRHAVNAWFDLQAGVRQDFGEEGERTHFVLGAEGLLPYWIETNARLFVSADGDVAARIEVEHDIRITPTLILQPRAELDLSIHDAGSPDEGSHLSLGLRLRYNVSALLQPYIGFDWAQELEGGESGVGADSVKVPDAALLLGLKAMF